MQVVKMESVASSATPRGVMARKLVDIPAVQVMNLLMKPGEGVPFHTTPVDVLFYVVNGKGTVLIGEESSPVEETDMVVSPKDIPHALNADRGAEFQVLVLKMPNPTLNPAKS